MHHGDLQGHAYVKVYPDVTKYGLSMPVIFEPPVSASTISSAVLYLSPAITKSGQCKLLAIGDYLALKVYVYNTHASQSQTQGTPLTIEDPEILTTIGASSFGGVVVMSGTYLLVTSRTDPNQLRLNQGRAYLFELNTAPSDCFSPPTLSTQQPLVVTGPWAQDSYFGWSAAILVSNQLSVVAVGAPAINQGKDVTIGSVAGDFTVAGPGCVYLWISATNKPSFSGFNVILKGINLGEAFGFSVALSLSDSSHALLAVGAPYANRDRNSATTPPTGLVYLYSIDHSGVVVPLKNSPLVPSVTFDPLSETTALTPTFGWAVSLSSNTLCVGAPAGKSIALS